MPRLTKFERDEATRVLETSIDLNLGTGLWLRFARATKGKQPQPYLIFRYTAPSGRRREMGLGMLQRPNLVEVANRLGKARVEMGGYREQLRAGVDPIEQQQADRARAKQALEMSQAAAKRERATLAHVAREYHERVVEPNRTTKHAAQWIRSLETHVPSQLWRKAITDIDAPELLDFVRDLQAKVPETAARVRQRLETVFDDAVFRKVCTSNPAAAIRRKLRETRAKRQRTRFAALPYAKAPAFVPRLREQEGIAARALEFALLTAARTAEVLGAVWSEVDAPARVWRVPAIRMKGGEEHTVHLCDRAIELIESMRELQQPYIFPSPTLNGSPLSNMAMLTLLRRMDVDGETTVHGLCRSTFSTWANETGVARPDVVEACLAHQEQDRIRAAYNRAQFAAERSALLEAWSAYLDGKPVASNVVDFSRTKAARA